MTSPEPPSTRRGLLAGLQPGRVVPDDRADPAGARWQTTATHRPWESGSTIRLTTRAMACDCSVIMDPGPADQINAASAALDRIHAIESWMSAYRESSELSQINRVSTAQAVRVRSELFQLLSLGMDLHVRTDGAFDMASGALTMLWRRCRQEQRIPTPHEMESTLDVCGMQHVELDAERQMVRFRRAGVVLDPGAIGKGSAVDEAAEWLQQQPGAPRSYLFHGGHSSLVARGPHNGHRGWPVGIGNPLFTERRLATVLLCDQAMGTSGSNIQFFRHDGRRYGHILNPKTGWPVDGMLSVTVVAPSAAVADALSTAFFVMGVENARLCCENWPDVGAILLPFPDRGTKVLPTVVGIDPELIIWDDEQVDLR